jgi:putative aldouronate transport system substrate-binding protein
MLKKNLVIAIALMLFASLVLVACGVKKDVGGTKTSAPESTKGTDAPVVLTWYTIGGAPKDLVKVNDEINKITMAKINAKINMKMLDWGDYDSKMKVVLASGEDYDIAFTSSWALEYFGNARKGAFYSIDKLLQNQGQGIVKVLNPSFLEGTKINGHNYGVSTNKELPQLRVFRFNKVMVDKYNLDISNVKTLQDLEPILKTFHEKEPGIAPIPSNIAYFLHYDYPVPDLPFIGVPLDTKDYKLVNVYEAPETISYLDTIHKYYMAGYLPKDVATQKEAGDYVKTGKWLVDVQDAVPFADNLWSADAGYAIVSKPMQPPLTFNWSVAGAMQAINVNSKNPEKAMEFLNLLYTDTDLMNLLDFGIEGVHYKKTGAQTKDAIPDSGYGFPGFTAGNLMLTYLNTSDPQDKWAQYKTFNDSATNSPMLGFQFDDSNVKPEIANLKNAKAAVEAALFTGTVDPNKFLAKAIQKYKESGLDKVMTEAQKQIDAWRAAKK